MNSGSDTAIRTARATVTSGYVSGPKNSTRFSSTFQIGAYAGNRHLGEGHVSEQLSIGRLEAIAANDAGEAPGPRRREQEQPPPVDVDVVAGLQAERERRDLVGRDAGRDREPEQRRARAERDERRRPAALLQGARHADDRCERAAAPGRQQRDARLRRRRGRELDRRKRRDRVGPGVEGEWHEGPPGVVEEAGVVPNAFDHVADPHDDVEVLPQTKYVEDRTEHALSKHPPPAGDQGRSASSPSAGSSIGSCNSSQPDPAIDPVRDRHVVERPCSTGTWYAVARRLLEC